MKKFHGKKIYLEMREKTFALGKYELRDHGKSTSGRDRRSASLPARSLPSLEPMSASPPSSLPLLSSLLAFIHRNSKIGDTNKLGMETETLDTRILSNFRKE